MTKELEIKTLTSLCDADGYFAEYFKRDLDQMTANIRNDFPIETATKFYSEAEAKDELIAVAKTEGKEKKEDLCRFMLLMADQLDDRDLDERVEQELGKAAKIKMQRGLGLQLSQEDIDYLISRL
jgi:hypothetical protein